MNIDLITYISITFLILFIVSKISYRLKLIDLPDKRKIHKSPTAYTGGLALSLIYLFSTFLFDLDFNKLNLILSTAVLVALIGFLDDKYELNVGGKLSLQIIPIMYLIVTEKLNLNHLGDYGYFKLNLNSISIPFTILAVMFLINSFNYFDGLDGTLSLTTISVLIILYFLSSNSNEKLYFISIFIPLLIFLLFNFSFLQLPKIFLGDSGSLLLGFVISFILIDISNQKIVHPILLAWSITIFVYEFISINLIRLFRKKGLFNPGLDHLHHILFKTSKSIFLTNFLIAMTNIFLFIVGYLSFTFANSLISLFLFIFLFFVFYIVRTQLLKKNFLNFKK